VKKIVWAGGCLLVATLLVGTIQAQQGVRFQGQAITEPLGPNDAPSYAVQGWVRTAEGEGLGGITVRIFTDGWDGALTTTRGDGYYEFAGLSFGNYKVTLLGVEADTVISGRVDGQTRVIVNFVRTPLAPPTPTARATPAGPTLTPTRAPDTPTPIPATSPTITFIRTATPLPAGTPEPSGRSSLLELFNLDLNVQLPDFRPLGNAFCLGGFLFVGCLVFVAVMSLARAMLWPGETPRPRRQFTSFDDPLERRKGARVGRFWQRRSGRHPASTVEREDLTGLQVIVGLGNPGRKYARHRHNVGFQCIDALAQAHGLTFNERKFRAELARGCIGETPVLLVKPQTFMNASGEAVAPLLGYYRRTPADLLVIYDDLDLPLGTVRIRSQGGAGGHKGMQSLIQHLKTQEFARLRVGIGRPVDDEDPADYVLQDFSASQRVVMRAVYHHVADAVRCVLSEGLEEAMNRFNRATTPQPAVIQPELPFPPEATGE